MSDKKQATPLLDELEALPGQIEALEQEQQALYETLSDPEIYRENGSEVARIQARLEDIDSALEAAYDDAAGVTAQINLNLLTRINRQLSGTITVEG